MTYLIFKFLYFKKFIFILLNLKSFKINEIHKYLFLDINIISFNRYDINYKYIYLNNCI